MPAALARASATAATAGFEILADLIDVAVLAEFEILAELVEVAGLAPPPARSPRRSTQISTEALAAFRAEQG